ncbi:MAG: YcaO-like family protein [Gammaproteobacteria bacterium]|nr:YcaO-like family protein [Gammaproteobacteria bacterium]
MPQMGITRIANVTGLDHIGIPVVMVCRPNSRSIAVSQGKGLTLNAAKASGLMEAVESWHAERIELPLKLGSFADLSDNHRFIDVHRLPEMRGSRYQPGLPILWIESIDLLDNASYWLPYETVHTFYAHPAPAGSGCFAQSSNGLASGNHYLEAVAHAICECVERDASSLWHHQSKAWREATKLDLATVADECCIELLAKLEAADLAVTLWDTTSDTGIPSFECVVLDEKQADVHPGQGAGCHPSKSIALVRAITVAAQVRTTYIAGSRDDLTHAEFAPDELEQRNRSFRDLVGSAAGKVDFNQLETHEFASFEQDVVWLLQRLESVGIDQVLCVDLSKSSIDIPVVRVVIPGLEGPHDEDDYIPGPRAREIKNCVP